MRITETLDKELPIDQPHREEAITEMNLEAPLEIIEEPPQHLVVSQTNVHSRLGERIWVEKGSQSQLSHTPPPRPPREPMINNQEVESSLERRSALERISQPVARMLLPDGDDQNIQLAPLSQDRLPVLQRIALPQANERVPLLHNGVANSDSGRLQEVEVQYMEDTFPMHILNTSGNPSSSRPPAKERLSLLQVSPIREFPGGPCTDVANCNYQWKENLHS
ncbi:hypothetical protein YC2023_078074 [Brassica napus]